MNKEHMKKLLEILKENFAKFYLEKVCMSAFGFFALQGIVLACLMH